MKAMTLSNRQKNITLASVFIVAGVLYCLISLVNHYLFKTYTLDLGLYNHAMYDYIHFQVDDCSMFMTVPRCILADHFDLYLMALSPLIYVFGSYTLLLVQIVAALLGGWGIYKLIGLYTDDDWLPILATAAFFFSFGVIHPFSFDYHSNVLTAMMLPWLLYFIKQKKFALASIFVVLFVIGKENMSLWLFFIVIGLMWDYRRDRKTIWHLAVYALFSMTYFFIINMIVMPRLVGSGGGFVRYAYLGDNYAEIAKNLLTNPGDAFRLLFVNTSGLSRFDGVKAEFYYCALASGMLLAILKPNYFIMLIPLIAQKMLASDGNLWGVAFHYSVEFVPVLVVSSFLVIVRLKKLFWKRILAVSLLLSIVLTTFYSIGVPKSHIVVDQLCVYQSRHYEQSNFDAHFARELIRQIPDDASVCAATAFVPHLALRPEIYDFYSKAGKVNADYVFITEPYFDYRKGDQKIFTNRGDYEIIATDGMVYLLKRKQL